MSMCNIYNHKIPLSYPFYSRDHPFVYFISLKITQQEHKTNTIDDHNDDIYGRGLLQELI